MLIHVGRALGGGQLGRDRAVRAPAVRATRAALPHLLDRTPAMIVTVSSVNAFLPDPGVIDYSAAKGALANFCKSLSKEFGPRGIRVNTVSPGPVETALWLGDHGVAATVAGAGHTDAATVVKQQEAAAPTGRFTRPEEVADIVALLASGRSGNITGTDVVIDGGLISTAVNAEPERIAEIAIAMSGGGR
jgi:NAD(P)-dependent dehydrogenase (short-subunit alcohol dehydrogenase family)